MFDHFGIKVSDFENCVKFYQLVLHPLKIEMKWIEESAAGFGKKGNKKVVFLIEKSNTSSQVHTAFDGIDQAGVNKFHEIGKSSGYRCNGEPGLREHYAPNYYAAFLLDPDGNNIEAVVYT